MTHIPNHGLGKLRQEDYCKLKASLGYKIKTLSHNNNKNQLNIHTQTNTNHDTVGPSMIQFTVPKQTKQNQTKKAWRILLLLNTLP